jgi:hypothetical protein
MTRRSIKLAVDVGNLLQELCLCDCRDIRLPPARVLRRPSAATVCRTQNAPTSVITLYIACAVTVIQAKRHCARVGALPRLSQPSAKGLGVKKQNLRAGFA